MQIHGKKEQKKTGQKDFHKFSDLFRKNTILSQTTEI
jgi:hypothetical protein